MSHKEKVTCIKYVRRTPESFKKEVRDLTGGEYKVLGDFIKVSIPVEIKHVPCGYTWNVRPNSFISAGNRCPRCAGQYSPSTDEYKKLVFELVGVDYSVIGEYVNNFTPITMRHNACGHVRNITPNNFITNGSRCPNCRFSRGEKAVADVLDSLSIEYTREYSFDLLGRKRFDFYLPDHNIAIEYDGEQHFKAVEYWGGEETLKRTQESDALKNAFCEQNGIDLLRIPYWEFNNIPEIVTDYIESVRYLNGLLQEKEAVTQ